MSPEAPKKSGNTYGEAPQEWKDYFNKFSDIRKRVLTEIISMPDEKQIEFLQRIKQKQEKSFDSVDDPYPYLTYHKSTGSSIGPLDTPLLDFEGEHSLLRFYEELEAEIDKDKSAIV